MSEPARIAGVFLEPGKAFADIVAWPSRWWIPVVLMALMGLTFTYCYSQRVGWDRMIRQTMESNERMQSLPADQREQAIERGIKFAGVMGYVGALLGSTVVVLVVAAVLMFVMNAMMGTQASYKQSLSIVSYSFLPGVLAGILSIIVLYLKNPEDFDIRNPLAFNGAALLSSTAPKWQVALATSFDVFSFWMMALMAVGFAATTRKLTWGKAFTGIVVCWLFWVVVKTGWAAMMG